MFGPQPRLLVVVLLLGGAWGCRQEQQTRRSKEGAPSPPRVAPPARRSALRKTALFHEKGLGTAPLNSHDRWWERPTSACGDAGGRGQVHSRYQSPSRRFEVLLCRAPRLFALPGGGSDAPGQLFLIDTQTARVLASGRLELVWTMEMPSWSGRAVEVKRAARWSLPAPEQATGGQRARAIYYEDGAIRAVQDQPTQ